MIDRAYARLDALREQARAVSSDVVESTPGGTHQARYERDVKVQATARRLADLADAGSGLVFGRIDRGDGERFYIGRTAVSDESNEPLVVDWRAPAAEPFYRATGRDPMGLRRRRHFLLRNRRLVGIEDDLLAPAEGGDREGEGEDLVLVGEAALLAALERGRTGRMADIVATIQREQDEIIRAPLPGLLVVQGGPGTGKTAVALHRAAYLLYTHRFPLERGGVLLVGPNRVFLRYVERVLPSLGEQTVVSVTPAALVPAVSVSGTEEVEVARLKGDSRMAGVVERGIRQRERPLVRPAAVLVGRHRLTLTPAASRRIVEQVQRAPGTHNERRARVERLVLRHFRRQWLARQAAEGAEEEWEEHASRLRRDPAVVEALERMWPVLTPAAFLHDLFGFGALVRAASAGALQPHEERLLVRRRSRRLADVAWTEADVALLDEAAATLGPLPGGARPAERDEGDNWLLERAVEDAGEIDEIMRADLLEHLSRWTRGRSDEEAPELATRTFSHVVVDEAQDLSPMQLRMLARRCPSGSMTIVGDLGQASRPGTPTSWKDVVRHIQATGGRPAAARRRPPTLVELTVNYRTPEEVMRVAARVLAEAAPGLTPPQSVRRSGAQPRFTRATAAGDLPALAAEVARRELEAVGRGRAAVIVPEALVSSVRAQVNGSEAGPGGFAAADADLLDADIAVLPLDLAKGLEFDAVVVVEPAAIAEEGPAGLRALYVALTRTTRHLHVVHARALPDPLT